MDSSVYQSRTISVVFATSAMTRLPLELPRRLAVRPHGPASGVKGWSRA